MTTSLRSSKLSAVSALMLLVSCGGQDNASQDMAVLTPRSQSNFAVVDPATAAAKNFTGNGIYWNAAESGTGMFFEAQGNTGVASFFLYEAGTGKAIWYVAAGAFIANVSGTYSFSGTLQSYKGGQSIGSSGASTVPTATPAGNVSIDFNGTSAAIKLPNRTINATRYEFGGPGGLNKPATGVQPETGIYWNDTQGGRGFTVEVQNNLAVTTVYHYNADGSPTWHFMVGDISNGIATGAFNGQTNGQTLDSAYVAPTAPLSAGTLRMEFTGACEGKALFNNQPAISLKRFAFGDLPAGKECRSVASTPAPTPTPAPAPAPGRAPTPAPTPTPAPAPSPSPAPGIPPIPGLGSLVPAPAPAPVATLPTPKLPHSGVTAAQCYQSGSNTMVSCTGTRAISLNAQQDGMRTTVNAMSYSTIALNPVTRCVKDNVTGLIWEGKEESGLRGGNLSYSNYDVAFGATPAQATAAGNAAAYVSYVNTLNLCGYTDWRLPTRDELESIVDIGSVYPAANATWFPNTKSYFYWTSSLSVVENDTAWSVVFSDGSTNRYSRSNTFAVRLVRSSP